MPKQIALPDGSVGEFPDAMPDSEIEKVLQKQYSSDGIDWLHEAGEFGRGLILDTAKGMYGAAKRVVAGPQTAADKAGYAAMGPLGPLVMDIAKSHVETGGKAIDAAKRGEFVQAAGYAGGALLPVLGPMAAQAGETIGSGEVSRGLGQAVALVAAPKAMQAAAEVAPAAGRLARALPGKAVELAKTPGVPGMVGGAGEVAAGVGAAASGHPIVGAGLAARGATVAVKGLAAYRQAITDRLMAAREAAKVQAEGLEGGIPASMARRGMGNPPLEKPQLQGAVLQDLQPEPVIPAGPVINRAAAPAQATGLPIQKPTLRGAILPDQPRTVETPTEPLVGGIPQSSVRAGVPPPRRMMRAGVPAPERLFTKPAMQGVVLPNQEGPTAPAGGAEVRPAAPLQPGDVASPVALEAFPARNIAEMLQRRLEGPEPPRPAAILPPELMTEDALVKEAAAYGVPVEAARKTVTKAGYKVVDRSYLNRALHGLGNEMGLDHAALSDKAAHDFGVKSLTQLSQEQMLEMHNDLQSKRSISEPLPKKSAFEEAFGVPLASKKPGPVGMK